MNRTEKIQRLEATLVRVLARKDITRIRNVPSAPTGPSPRPVPAKHVGIEAFMGPPMNLPADDLSEVPTSLIPVKEEAERSSIAPAPEPAFRVEGRPAAKAPEPVAAKAPSIAPEPVVAKAPSITPEPEPVAKTPTLVPEPEPVVAKAPSIAPEPVVAKAPSIAPLPEVVPTPSADAEITLEEPEELELDVTEEPELARAPEPAPEIVPEIQRVRESIPAPVEPESLKPPRPSTPAPTEVEPLRAEAFAPAPLPALSDVVRVEARAVAERPKTLRGMIERALSLRPRR